MNVILLYQVVHFTTISLLMNARWVSDRKHWLLGSVGHWVYFRTRYTNKAASIDWVILFFAIIKYLVILGESYQPWETRGGHESAGRNKLTPCNPSPGWLLFQPFISVYCQLANISVRCNSYKKTQLWSMIFYWNSRHQPQNRANTKSRLLRWGRGGILAFRRNRKKSTWCKSVYIYFSFFFPTIFWFVNMLDPMLLHLNCITGPSTDSW